jgi:hypothetical protein
MFVYLEKLFNEEFVDMYAYGQSPYCITHAQLQWFIHYRNKTET